MEFIFSIKNHYFEKGTPWVELDKIKQRSWLLSVDYDVKNDDWRGPGKLDHLREAATRWVRAEYEECKKTMAQRRKK